MKKTLYIILALCLVLTLAACGGGSGTGTTEGGKAEGKLAAKKLQRLLAPRICKYFFFNGSYACKMLRSDARHAHGSSSLCVKSCKQQRSCIRHSRYASIPRP